MNIIELAKQANGEPAWPGGVDWTWDELKTFAKLVEEHTRKEWAKEFAGLGEWQCVHIIEDRNHNP